MATFPWWLLPSAAALILVATHTYLGLHVISRNVFFVDLALAQVAALGSSVAFLYGFDLNDSVTYYVSLLFAGVGAWFFSIARSPDQRIPEEAVIGLTFAIASAGTILLSAENPHGAEHLRDIMAGSILVVSGHELRHAALLYALIAVFHWVFRKPLLGVSLDRSGAERRGVRVRLWDFLFYLSFAIVITSSVRIAGVLLVFVLLIAPALCGAMLATSIRARLLLGWGTGIAATCGGLGLSAHMDWPPAPAISCVFAFILLGAAAALGVRRSARPGRTLLSYSFAAGSLLAAGFGLRSLLGSELLHARAHSDGRSTEAGEVHWHASPEHEHADPRQELLIALSDDNESVRAQAVEKLGKLKDAALLPELIRALNDRSDAVKEMAARSLGSLASPAAASALAAALANSRPGDDEWVTLRRAEALAQCGDRGGVAALLRLAIEADAKLVRIRALERALELTGHPTKVADDEEGHRKAVAELEAFWSSEARDAHWDPSQARFMLRQ